MQHPTAHVQSQPADDLSVPHGSPRAMHARALRGPAPAALLNAKHSALAEVSPEGASALAAPLAPLAPSGTVPITTVFSGLNQPGLGAVDNSEANQGSPSDSTGAIGPSHYIEFVNSKMAVYRRSDLGLVTQRDLDSFVGRAGQSVFDPQIQWDQQGGRWLYLALDVDSSGNNFLAFGWSKTSDPTDLNGGWCRWVASTDLGGSFLEDYPKLGHDDSRVIFGSNSISGDSFVTAHVWTFAKPAVGQTTCGTAPSVHRFGSFGSPLQTADGDVAVTPVPANTTDSSTGGYVVAADLPFFGTPGNQIMAWHLSGTAGSPTLVQDGNINVTTYDVPANVPQPGTSNTIDSLDTRLTQAVARNDPDAGGAKAVWTQHTVDGPSGRSVVRWYELIPATDSARQQGTISDPNNFAFNGAISPTAAGNSTVIFYNLGSTSLLAQIRAQSRRSGTGLGEMGGELTLGTSAAANDDFTCTPPNGPPCRWGDYAGASPDPVNTEVVWGTNALNGPATTDPAWQTRNFAVTTLDATGYPRPKGATPVYAALVVAYQPCGTTNRVHAPPLSFASCAAPVQTSPFLTVGTPDSNGAVANSVGSVRLKAIVGVPGPPDDSDLQISASVTDVRCRAGATPCGPANAVAGADFTGQLTARALARITDQRNGGSGTESATGQDTQLAFTVPCTSTASTAQGATCSVATSLNAQLPGAVVDGTRAIFALDTIEVLDGGPDGVASTAGNSVFMRQGLFVP